MSFISILAEYKNEAIKTLSWYDDAAVISTPKKSSQK